VLSVHNIISSDDGRLRAIWRIALFLLVTGAVYLFVTSVVGTLLAATFAAFNVRFIVLSYVTLLALVVGHIVMLRWFERERGWSFVGLGVGQASPRQLATGLLLGALAIGLPSVVLLLTGEIRIEPSAVGSSWEAAWRAAILLLPAALVEELLLRGYIFAVLREAIGWKGTLIGTSIVFGLLHLNNPGANAESAMLVVVAGFFLGGVMLAMRSLYAAWMAHFAWNWVMAGAMHTAVSGIGLAAPNYRIVSAGPVWLTGGGWGPEGGFAAGMSMIAFALFLYGKHLRNLANND
jgi:membrane protease YdiL (CAAX protease family)